MGTGRHPKIGEKVRIEYADQNEMFARCLPVEGIAFKRLTDQYGSDDWFVVDLGVEEHIYVPREGHRRPWTT